MCVKSWRWEAGAEVEWFGLEWIMDRASYRSLQARAHSVQLYLLNSVGDIISSGTQEQ